MTDFLVYSVLAILVIMLSHQTRLRMASRIYLLFILVLLSHSKVAAEDPPAATITWSGKSFESARYWISDKPCGKGKKGFDHIIKLIKNLPEKSTVIIRPYRADFAGLTDTHSRWDEMPFAENIDAKAEFEKLTFDRHIRVKLVLIDSLKGLPNQ